MNDLSNTIYRYYRDHFDELPSDKQFHFASRLYLWDQPTELVPLLQGLRAEFTANDSANAALQQVIRTNHGLLQHGTKNVGSLRQPYFERYPKLRLYVTVLFRCLFLETIYGLDARSPLLTLFSLKELQEFYTQLLEDQAAIAILSTHAINFFYLYSRIVLDDEQAFEPSRFLEIGRTAYNHDDTLQLQLLVYLYTHCVIGESSFYSRPIGDHNKETYMSMITELEKIMDTEFENINLDNKFEFLICNRLLQRTSILEKRIFAEADQSLSPHGDYLVDTLNHNPSENIDLASSEHRNVLFIMANWSFKPKN